MHSWNDLFRAAVPVGIAWSKLPFSVQKHVIHAPRINRETVYLAIRRFRRPNTGLHLADKRLDIPYKMPVFRLCAVMKTVYFFCDKFPVLHPADYVAA